MLKVVSFASSHGGGVSAAFFILEQPHSGTAKRICITCPFDLRWILAVLFSVVSQATVRAQSWARSAGPNPAAVSLAWK